jgi:asparagine synthetase B (glutamine-hydrolysing)
LTELTGAEIHTYTVGLPECNEFKEAQAVAEYYGTTHENITALDIARTFSFLIPILERPRFNLWVMYAYIHAARDGCENVYVAEGLDEHFGGYENKPPMSPQETWGGVLEWSLPTHRQVAEFYRVNLHTPFITLPLAETVKWWRDPHVHGAKYWLKAAYTGLIPDFVIDRPKVAGRFNWENLTTWRREFGFLGDPPQSHEEANRRINKWATQIWVEGQR